MSIFAKMHKGVFLVHLKHICCRTPIHIGFNMHAFVFFLTLNYNVVTCADILATNTIKPLTRGNFNINPLIYICRHSRAHMLAILEYRHMTFFIIDVPVIVPINLYHISKSNNMLSTSEANSQTIDVFNLVC